MPSRKFAFESGGTPRVEVIWQGNFKGMRVTVDGRDVGVFANKAALLQGNTFDLDHGDTLTVRLARSFIGTELILLRNGAPLPGSDNDPERHVKAAVGMLWFVVGLNVVVGLLAIAGVEALTKIGAGWGSFVGAAIYAGLALLTARRHQWALIIATIVFILDGVTMFAMSLSHGGLSPIGPTISRLIFMLPMLRGIPAIATLNKAKAAAPQPSSL